MATVTNSDAMLLSTRTRRSAAVPADDEEGAEFIAAVQIFGHRTSSLLFVVMVAAAAAAANADAYDYTSDRW
jgi:hypothetical protein